MIMAGILGKLLGRRPEQSINASQQQGAEAVTNKAEPSAARQHSEKLTQWFAEEEDRQIKEVRERLARAKEVLDHYSAGETTDG